MANKSQRKQALVGAFLLTVAAFIAKLLSAVYRIPFQNMVGNVGFYVYQQIYPIYGIGMTFALSGLPMFISKLIVDNHDPHDQVAIIYRLQLFLMGLSLLAFGGLQFGAGAVAEAMADPRLTPVIRAVSWMFLLMPFLATWRGYFQGKLNMLPTAYSQVIEQVVRVTFILGTAGWAVKHMADPYRIGTLAMWSAPIAGLCAFSFLLVEIKRMALPKSSHRVVYPRLFSKVMVEGGTLCLVSAVMLLLQLVDSFSVVAGLKEFGLTLSAAQNIKGIYDRSQTLVQLGMVVTTASVAAMLPNLSLARLRKQNITFNHIAKTNLRTNVAIAAAMSFGLWALMPEINRLLFSSSELNGTIELYCLSIVFASIILTYSTILQAQDHYWVTMLAILIGFFVKLEINRQFVAIFGIPGASLATLIGLVAMIICIRSFAPQQLAKLFSGRQFFKLSLILILMVLSVELALGCFDLFFSVSTGRLGALIRVGIGILVGVTIFLYGSFKLRVFTLREWFAIPFMSDLMRFTRKLF